MSARIRATSFRNSDIITPVMMMVSSNKYVVDLISHTHVIVCVIKSSLWVTSSLLRSTYNSAHRRRYSLVSSANRSIIQFDLVSSHPPVISLYEQLDGSSLTTHHFTTTSMPTPSAINLIFHRQQCLLSPLLARYLCVQLGNSS